MADVLNTGADFEGYEDFCETLANQLKNNWRSSDPLAGFSALQPGMIVSDSDDEHLWHIIDTSPGFDMVLQEVSNQDAEPIFAKLKLEITVSDVSNPPTDAQLDSVFTSPSAFGNEKFAFLKDTNSAGNIFLVMAYEGVWYVAELAEAV